MSGELLQHVSGVFFAEDTLESIYNVFQHHTLVNRLGERCEFYPLKLRPVGSMLSYINRILHLRSVQKWMSMDGERNEMAMAILKELPRQYDNIIRALDALGDEKAFLAFKNVKGHLLQYEQRLIMKDLWRKRKRHFWAITATQRWAPKIQELQTQGAFQRTLLRQVPIIETRPYSNERQWQQKPSISGRGQGRVRRRAGFSDHLPKGQKETNLGLRPFKEFQAVLPKRHLWTVM